MTLSNGDKAICAQIAGEVVEKVLQIHVSTCPHGLKLKVSRAYLIGMCMGCGVAAGVTGGGVGVALFKLLSSWV